MPTPSRRLTVGRVRYGVMLREDGHVFDDGTVARLAADRFFLTTTTAHAEKVLRHWSSATRCSRPSLDVSVLSVTDRWAQLAIAGPSSRDLLGQACGSTASICPPSASRICRSPMSPFAAACSARLYRISFSGELGYELGVASRLGDALMRRLARPARPLGIAPYGTEAMTVLRVEKGFAASGELNGQTTARDLGLADLLSTKKDFIGRAMLQSAGLHRSRPADPGVLRARRPLAAYLRAGSHFLDIGADPTIENDQGYMTSVAYSPMLGHSIGLGLLKRGSDASASASGPTIPCATATSRSRLAPPADTTPREGARVSKPSLAIRSALAAVAMPGEHGIFMYC